jgi:hypothetical protein
VVLTGFDNVRQPLWTGTLIVFPFNARALPGGENVFDLGAISEDGAIAGTIATEVLQYTWRQDRDIYDNVLPNPRRIFSPAAGPPVAGCGPCRFRSSVRPTPVRLVTVWRPATLRQTARVGDHTGVPRSNDSC